MRQKPVIRQNTYHCGPKNKKANYLEIKVFEYLETLAPRKARKKKENLTTPKQQNLNDKYARWYFGMLVKSNYGEGDIYITLTYEDGKQPKNIEEAEHEVYLYMKRLRRLYKKHGKNLKYIYVTEQGSKKGKIHHHVLINHVGISRDELETVWHKKGLGQANSKRIRENFLKGIEQIANYLQKEPAGKKRWKNSQNLIRPWMSTSDDKYSRRKIDKMAQLPPDCEAVKEFWERQFPGYMLYECQHYFNQVTSQWSIYLKMRLRR